MSGRPPMSRLPDNPAYWESLAARSVTAALAATPVATGQRPAPWWHWLSAAGYRLAAGAVMAVLLAVLLRNERTAAVPAATAPLASLVAPEDRLLRAVLETDATVPDDNQMLRLVALRAEKR